jgi:glutamyl-tRNA synthetase
VIRVALPHHLRTLAGVTGEVELDPQLLAKQGSESPTACQALETAEHALEKLEPFAVATIEQTLNAVVQEQGWKPRHFFMPIRVALSGKTATPPLVPMIAALGRQRTLTRLRDGIARL